jgi:hypothetical protein
MSDELVISSNALADLIKWSKDGYIIILNTSYGKSKYFSMPDNKQSDRIIQINFTPQWNSLIEDDEWSWYMINSGCVELNMDDVSLLDLSNVIKFSM